MVAQTVRRAMTALAATSWMCSRRFAGPRQGDINAAAGHGAWVAMRRERRESRSATIAEADKTIELLKEQTALLRQQGETREVEWHRLEQTWQERETRLEARIAAVEGDYRRLVLTVTSMGLCANAPYCANYNPGDGRIRRARNEAVVPSNA